jgi:hypothetical protein
VAELDSEEGWGYDEVARDESEDRDARDKDDWDLVDEEVSL